VLNLLTKFNQSSNVLCQMFADIASIESGTSINQSINLFVQKFNKHWTGHQGRMQPPLTGARKNNVSKSNK